MILAATNHYPISAAIVTCVTFTVVWGVVAGISVVHRREQSGADWVLLALALLLITLAWAGLLFLPAYR